jgi:hypothetical protein
VFVLPFSLVQFCQSGDDPQEIRFTQIWLIHAKYESKHPSSVFYGFLLEQKWSCTTHRKQHLAKFGYTLNMEVNILLLYFVATYLTEVAMYHHPQERRFSQIWLHTKYESKHPSGFVAKTHWNRCPEI